MVLWVYVIAGSFVFVGLLTVRKGVFSNSFACSRYFVLPIELPYPASIGWLFALSCCFLLCLSWVLSLRGLLFSVNKGSEGRVYLRWEVVVRWEKWGKGNCGQGILYEWWIYFHENIHFGTLEMMKRVWPICLNGLPQEWRLFFAALLPFSIFTNFR